MHIIEYRHRIRLLSKRSDNQIDRVFLLRFNQKQDTGKKKDRSRENRTRTAKNEAASEDRFFGFGRLMEARKKAGGRRRLSRRRRYPGIPVNSES